MPALTVNPPASDAASCPVFAVTVCPPVGVVGPMARLAVRWVASVTEMLLAVMPLPKFNWLVPCAKWVKLPTIATPVSVWP